DYQRAERLLPQKMRKLVFSGDVTPNWIEKTSRFWYRRVGPKETTYVLIDADKNTSAPAFDHAQLAAALSKAAKKEFKATELPFESFEFSDGGRAIRFRLEEKQWTCTIASVSGECKETPDASRDPYERVSPDR